MSQQISWLPPLVGQRKPRIWGRASKMTGRRLTYPKLSVRKGNRRFPTCKWMHMEQAPPLS
jgi:hypothetical protein